MENIFRIIYVNFAILSNIDDIYADCASISCRFVDYKHEFFICNPLRKPPPIRRGDIINISPFDFIFPSRPDMKTFSSYKWIHRSSRLLTLFSRHQ